MTNYDEAGAIKEASEGIYGEEGYVWQAYSPLARYGDMQAIIGSWIVGDSPAGIDVRETSKAITSDLAFFVPHYIKL